MKQVIHMAGKFENGVQKCSHCDRVIFKQDEKDLKLYRVPQRVARIKNNTTKPVVISAKGWTEGIFIKDCGRKMEVTNERPNCN